MAVKIQSGGSSDELLIDPTSKAARVTLYDTSGVVSVAVDRTTAVAPSAVRLTDGSSFYKATTPADTQPISASALPLPAGAATETTLATLLTLAGFQARINTLGQKAMSASTPVTLASDQSALAVTGTFWQATQPVSGAFFQATQPISAVALPLPSGAATEATLATMLTLAGFQARVNTLGQKAMAASAPVTLASDQSALAVTGTFFQATQPVSAAALPLPSGAATEATLATMLTLAGFQARINTQGQKAMAASTPVTLASDQSALPVTGTFFQATQPVSVAATLPISTAATASTTTVAHAQAATATLSNVTSSASSTPVLAANATRKGALFYNDSTANLFLKFGATASATSYTVKLTPASLFELPLPCYTGALDGIWASANGACRVTELT